MRHRLTSDEELALILEEGEGYTLEFKQSVNADLPKEMVAFANASGGRIVVGVNDRHQIVGCNPTNKMLSQIQDMAAACDPPVAIHIEKLPRHRVLIVHVPEGANRPHRCSKGFYLRNGASSQKMSTRDITAFIQAEGRIRFDQQLRLDLDWAEALDENRLRHFLDLAKISPVSDIASMLFNLGAGDYKNGNFYLNQTGVLFFAKEPTQRLFHASVVCALFKGTGKSYILDRKELTGNLLENVEEALLFLKKHLQLRWEITRQSTRRKEILELPEVALREAMVNAVCHRDYLEAGAQVMVEIFDDRVEIYNPGGLPKGLPPSEFGKRSVCRNPLIAGLLLRCNYIEKMGTGIARIHAALEREHCPKADIRFDSFFALSFPRSTYAQSGTEAEATREKTREEPRVKTRVKILELIAENPQITTSQLAESIGITAKGIEWQITRLKQDGLLKRIGPAKGGRWDVKKGK